MLSPDVTILKSQILQHALHVIPARCAEKRNCLKNSYFVLFNVLKTHNDSSDRQRNEKCKLLRDMPDAVLPGKFFFLERKGCDGK